MVTKMLLIIFGLLGFSDSQMGMDLGSEWIKMATYTQTKGFILVEDHMTK